MVPEPEQAHSYSRLPVIPGWMQVWDYQWGYPDPGVSPALEEVEPLPCVSLLGLCRHRGLHLPQAFPSCGTPVSTVFQPDLRAGCRTLV